MLGLYNVLRVTPCKGKLDSLGSWIPSCGFRIPSTGFQSLTLELGSLGFNRWWDSEFFRIIPDSTRKNFPNFGIPYLGR